MHGLMAGEDFGGGLTKSEENNMLKDQLLHMQQKMSIFEEEGIDLIEFNKELQWTLLQMKKDNEVMR